MKAFIKIGDLFDTKCDVVAHQVNCTGVMGSGVAKIVKSRYPEVFKEYKDSISELGTNVLGGCLIVKCINENRYIANIYGQYTYNGCKFRDPYVHTDWNTPWVLPDPSDSFFEYGESTKYRYTNYEAFYRSITKLRVDMNKMNLKSVAFPYKIGSDRGAADWNVILSMINSIFEPTDIKVVIYKLKEDIGDVVCKECGALMNEYHHRMYKCTNPNCTHEYWN